MYNFIWVSCSISKFRKTNNSKKMPGLTEGEKDGQKDRWKDRKILFYRTYRAFAEGPKSEEKFNPSCPMKIGDCLKKISFMTIQQHLYFTWLFEVSYSIFWYYWIGKTEQSRFFFNSSNENESGCRDICVK